MTPTPSAPVIETVGLAKRFGKTIALRGVDLRIPAGRVTAVLGRNGSGKSTLLRILLGVEAPTAGRASVLGVDSQALDPGTRRRIGVLVEGHPTHGWMTVAEAERFTRRFYPAWDGGLFERVLEHFRIDRKQKSRHLSRGQRGGLSLGLVLAAGPDLLVFDDPALGLDPLARRALLEAMLFASRESGRSIVFSSHDLADVERLAERVVVIDRGAVRADCSAETLNRRLVRLRVSGEAGTPDALSGVPGGLESGLWVVGEDGAPEADQRAALAELPFGVELEPLSLPEALEALMDSTGPRRSFFERLDAPPTAAALV